MKRDRIFDLIIVGAGPYGLALAAHAKQRGIEYLLLGRPMSFWHDHMPSKMLLRSVWSESSLSDPLMRYRLDDYVAMKKLNRKNLKPIPLAVFLDYAKWFQEQSKLCAVDRKVQKIEKSNGTFALRLDADETLLGKNLAVATGIGYFANTQPLFESLPKELWGHSSQIVSFERFRGQRVLVVGAGQSALESAALLAEAGAEPELVFRGKKLRYRNITLGLSSPEAIDRASGAIQTLFRMLPIAVRLRVMARLETGSGAPWIRQRIEGRVKIHVSSTIEKLKTCGDWVRVIFKSGVSTHVDFLLLCSGYKVNLERLPFLKHPTIRRELSLYNGFPKLDRHYQSTVRGMYFVGHMTTQDFGPLGRTAVGSGWQARSIISHVTRN